MSKIAFSGSQTGMTPAQLEVLRRLLSELKPEWLYHGCCIGADAEANREARAIGIKTYGWPSDIRAKRAAGLQLDLVEVPRPPLVRNKLIVKLCESLIATPFQMTEVLRSGTWATIRAAVALRRPCRIILPDGQVRYV